MRSVTGSSSAIRILQSFELGLVIEMDAIGGEGNWSCVSIRWSGQRCQAKWTWGVSELPSLPYARHSTKIITVNNTVDVVFYCLFCCFFKFFLTLTRCFSVETPNMCRLREQWRVILADADSIAMHRFPRPSIAHSNRPWFPIGSHNARVFTNTRVFVKSISAPSHPLVLSRCRHNTPSERCAGTVVSQFP